MVDRFTPLVLAIWAVLAVEAAVLNTPFVVKLIVLGSFLLMGTGAAIARHLPGLRGAAAGSIIFGTSIATLILVSQAFVHLGVFDPGLVLATIVAVDLAVVLIPSPAARARARVSPR